MMLKEWITRTLTDHLSPERVEVEDDSHRHAGHSGWREGGETHFNIDVVAAAFEGKSRVERHRMVNELLQPAFQRGLHAVAIRTRAPGE